MRLALVSDIHGNDRALAAVVAELSRLDVQSVVCLGDVVQGGDEPVEVLDRLAELGWPVILGNADDFLLNTAALTIGPIEPLLEKRAWTLAQLSPAHMGQIRSFVPTLNIQLGHGRTLLAFHGSPRSYENELVPETVDVSAWAGTGADVLAGGHTHLQCARVIDGALYVNPGSVGAADDGLAHFAVMTGASVVFKQVAWKEVR